MDLNKLRADAEALPKDSDLGSVRALADKAEDLTAEIDSLETLLAERKRDLNNLLRQELPDAMDSVGLTDFTTSKGRKVQVKDFVDARIPKASEMEALAWLAEHGHGDLVKEQLTLKLPKGQGPMVDAIISSLWETYRVAGERKSTVHPQTLKAFCKEQLAKGEDIPADLFGLFTGRIVTIK